MNFQCFLLSEIYLLKEKELLYGKEKEICH
jgi:hypothetical protein